jgi:hypothetical protein
MTHGKDAEAGRLMGRRAVRWAVARTARDARLATALGQPISARNVRRLLQRRLGAALGRHVREGEILVVVGWMMRNRIE